MKQFFNEEVLLNNEIAKKIYSEVKDLPIIDYHCHLNQDSIANNNSFLDIGELMLSSDHYKWRAMRMCGVDEHYITGNASYYEKFVKYAEIMPYLIGNPLYYWTHMELVSLFDIHKPLNKESADEIYQEANLKLKDLSVLNLLKKFKVEYIATTDDPIDDLINHKDYENIKVRPTFRPDTLFKLESEYLKKLGILTNINIDSLDNLLKAIIARLDYFASKECKISDHGFEKFPRSYCNYEEASKLFDNKNNLNEVDKEKLFGFILVFLAKEYAKRNMIMQLHFSVVRNNNLEMFDRCGVDSGFDLIGKYQNAKDIILFLNQMKESERPCIILYSLNSTNIEELATLTGAFRNVKLGAAWWFNDTLNGIRRNIEVCAEYSALGTSFGMLTDSRSFSSYVRFDFYRRILSSYLGELVENGVASYEDALKLANDICYNNIKEKLL